MNTIIILTQEQIDLLNTILKDTRPAEQVVITQLINAGIEKGKEVPVKEKK